MICTRNIREPGTSSGEKACWIDGRRHHEKDFNEYTDNPKGGSKQNNEGSVI